VPEPGRNFVTYHPPLYHLLGALALRLDPSTRSLQALTTLAGIALVGLVALHLGSRGWRGLVLIAFLPVLLLTEPQVTNEVLLALLATAALLLASRARAWPWAVAAGAMAGLALLCRYTGVLVLAAVLVAVLLGAGERRAAAGRAAAALATAAAIGFLPYAERLGRYGDPFAGNWDDALGQPYRQPPGFRTAAWFLRFGASFLAHPFEARRASLWDSLYVSTFGDGFGRFVAGGDGLQHASLLALAWAAAPLAVVVLAGWLQVARRPAASGPLECAGLLLAMLLVAAVARFTLELPYWSAAKGVFLLALALPAATAFERGRAEAVRRGGAAIALLLDAALLVHAAVAVVTFTYRA
jgi:4-amino-4-deoxy-L-arabinose transferase-like glycosyltransferase